MITQETAAKIWQAHREIATAFKMLEDLDTREKAGHNKHARNLPDAFGRPQALQLGVPLGEGRHKLLDVGPDLADAVIRAHIAAQESLLAVLMVQARQELEGGAA